MKNLEYNLHKIASNNKLLIEILTDKTVLNIGQNDNFCILFNGTQKLMRDTAIEFLTLKEKIKLAAKLKSNQIYISEHVKIVENSLFELRKEINAKFDKKLIQFINTNNY